MKKIILIALFIFTVSPCLAVFGYDNNVGEIIGYITEIDGDIIHVVGEPLRTNGYVSAPINIGDAPVYDLITGLRVSADDIQKDMDVRVAYNLTEPFSAMVVWLNWDEDNAAVFTVEVSENINHAEDGTVFLSADGKYRVAIMPDTIILDPYNGFLSPADIKPGMEFFVWVDLFTASTPALVYPEKVVVVR